MPAAIRESASGAKFATLTFQVSDIELAQPPANDAEADALLQSLREKKVSFNAAWSARYGRFLALNVRVVK